MASAGIDRYRRSASRRTRCSRSARTSAGAQTAADALAEGGSGTGCARVLGAAVAAADRAEAATMDQLESLREAGVPDAGGEGICVILKGLLGAITGALPAVRFHEAERPIARQDGHGEDSSGSARVPDRSRGTLRGCPEGSGVVEDGGNRSVVVVGDPGVRVHAHSLDPHGLVDSAGKFGRFRASRSRP